MFHDLAYALLRQYYRGKYHCTIDLLFDCLGIRCMTTEKFCFYLENRLIQTGQTGGQLYSDTSPFSVPWLDLGKFFQASKIFANKNWSIYKSRSIQCPTLYIGSWH